LMDRIAGSEFVEESASILKSIKSSYSVPGNLIFSKLFAGSPLVNIVFTSSYFQPFSNFMDKTFIFVGPSLFSGVRQETVEFPWENMDSSKLLVYISMGTLYRQDPAFFKTCFTAFRDTPYQVIISVGRGTDISSLGAIPENFIVRPYVPQPDLLARASVFISHGGMGGISEAMHYGVPMLLLPKTIEQQLNARRIHKLGAGIDTRAEQDVPATVLKEETSKLLANPSFKQNAQKIGDSFSQTGGVGAAVDAVEEVPALFFKRKKLSNVHQERSELLNKWAEKVIENLKFTCAEDQSVP